MSAHTPGPWNVCPPHCNGGKLAVTARNDGTPFCTSEGWHFITEDIRGANDAHELANARLIAAAPALLLALQNLTESVAADAQGDSAGNTDLFLAQARFVISKATGSA